MGFFPNFWLTSEGLCDFLQILYCKCDSQIFKSIEYFFF